MKATSWWLIYGFLAVFGQQRSMAQSYNQNLATKKILVSGNKSLLVLVFLFSITIRRKREYHQPLSLSYGDSSETMHFHFYSLIKHNYFNIKSKFVFLFPFERQEDKAAPYTGSQYVTGSVMDLSHFNCKVQYISCIISDKLTNFPFDDRTLSLLQSSTLK